MYITSWFFMHGAGVVHRSDDSLFIVDITKADRQGWLARDFWSWIKEL